MAIHERCGGRRRCGGPLSSSDEAAVGCVCGPEVLGTPSLLPVVLALVLVPLLSPSPLEPERLLVRLRRCLLETIACCTRRRGSEASGKRRREGRLLAIRHPGPEYVLRLGKPQDALSCCGRVCFNEAELG